MEVPELKYVDFELKDGIGMITMNNPEKLNALTMEGAQSLTKILNACSDSPEVRVIVIRGAQGNFCGGGDVKGMKYKVDNNCCETRPGLRCNNDVILSIVNNAKPVIAWLEGAVAGGGLSIALACDFSYAQLASKFVFAFEHWLYSGYGFLSYAYKKPGSSKGKRTADVRPPVYRRTGGRLGHYHSRRCS